MQSEHLHWHLAEEFGLDSEDCPVVLTDVDQLPKGILVSFELLSCGVLVRLSDLLDVLADTVKLVFNQNHRLEVQCKHHVVGFG